LVCLASSLPQLAAEAVGEHAHDAFGRTCDLGVEQGPVGALEDETEGDAHAALRDTGSFVAIEDLGSDEMTGGAADAEDVACGPRGSSTARSRRTLMPRPAAHGLRVTAASASRSSVKCAGHRSEAPTPPVHSEAPTARPSTSIRALAPGCKKLAGVRGTRRPGLEHRSTALA
jgi:hypothetical protein